MKQYIKNLFLALYGHDPYAWELSEARAKFDIKTVDYEHLREQYQKALALWNDAATECEIAKGQLDKALNLIENLRERLSEREKTIKQIHQGYQNRNAKMAERISELQKEVATLTSGNGAAGYDGK